MAKDYIIPAVTGKHHDWMKDFTDSNLTLCDITFPASHDAGLSHAKGGYHAMANKKFGKADTVCQYYTVADQLRTGSRAFDLRIAKTFGSTRCFHGEALGSAGPVGGFGAREKQVFEDVNEFFKAGHEGEIVILRISHTLASEKIHKLLKSLIDTKFLFTCPAGTNLATVPLRKLRGKAIAIFDKKALKVALPGQGFHRFIGYSKDGKISDSRDGLPICGKYAGQGANPHKIVDVAHDFGNQHGKHKRGGQKGGRKHDHLFMVYWQEAFQVEKNTVTKRTPRAPDLKKYLSDRGLSFNLDYLLNLHLAKPGVEKGPMSGGTALANNGKIARMLGKKEPSYPAGTGPPSKVTKGHRHQHRPNWVNLVLLRQFCPPRPNR